MPPESWCDVAGFSTRRCLRPAHSVHRQYQALRAHFVDNLSMCEAANRFGYELGTFRNLCTAFRKHPDRTLFETRKPGPKRKAALPVRSECWDRAMALRKQRNGTGSRIVNQIAAT